MRRLPVFFVLDCSESMIGDNLEKVEEGLRKIVQELRSDPYALETIYISVIAFAGVAKVIAPLLDLVSFYPPKLPVGGGTSLGAALNVLMKEIDQSVVKKTMEQKGDWRPLVYLFTDGKPTDKVDSAINEWQGHFKNKATIIAVAFGQFADLTVLNRLTDKTFIFEESQEGDFKKFVDWVSASLVVQSKSVGKIGNVNELAEINGDFLKKIEHPTSLTIDQDCVALVGRCQSTRRPYLMKYDRISSQINLEKLSLGIPLFKIAGCFPITEDYFSWSDVMATDQTINTDELVGSPGCPHCGNVTAFAMCECGKLMCMNGPGNSICPWCEKKLVFMDGRGASDGFDVVRGKG